MTPAPPEPPPPIEVPAGAPTAPVPLPTLRWLALRDLYAEELEAYTLDITSRHTLALAEVETGAWLLEDCRADLAVVERRPTWQLTAGLVVAAALGGVVAWEVIR